MAIPFLLIENEALACNGHTSISTPFLRAELPGEPPGAKKEELNGNCVKLISEQATAFYYVNSQDNWMPYQGHPSN